MPVAALGLVAVVVFTATIAAIVAVWTVAWWAVLAVTARVRPGRLLPDDHGRW